MRFNNRANHELRDVKITKNYTKYADGSILIESGETKVICTATIENELPPFLKNKNKGGWVTAEYAMLPSSTHSRNKRDANNGKVNARSQEISRLIGRSLRSIVDLKKLGDRQIVIDCDVIQADGGTRTASITGGFIALSIAIQKLLDTKIIAENPLVSNIAAISVGICNNEVLLDLDYIEDSNCDADFNFVLNDVGDIIDLQGTGESRPITRKEMDILYDYAIAGVKQLIEIQKEILR